MRDVGRVGLRVSACTFFFLWVKFYSLDLDLVWTRVVVTVTVVTVTVVTVTVITVTVRLP